MIPGILFWHPSFTLCCRTILQIVWNNLQNCHKKCKLFSAFMKDAQIFVVNFNNSDNIISAIVNRFMLYAGLYGIEW